MKIQPGNTGFVGKQSGIERALRYSFLVGLLAVILTPAIPSRANADSESATNDSMRPFWNMCQRKMTSLAEGDVVRVRHFGQDERVADMLANLIAAGEKTGTFTSPWLFEGDPNETPVLGGYTVVTDFHGKPRLLLRTTAVSTMRFDEISENETGLDGPSIRTLAVWRQVHLAYFGRRLAKVGRTPSPGMPVTVESFEVVCDYTAINNAS